MKRIVNLKDFVYFQEGPGVRNWQFKDKGIKLLNVKNIVNSNLDLTNTERYLDIEEVETSYKHFLLNPGDIVMASSGVTWGKTAIVYKEHLPLCLNTSTIRFRTNDDSILCQEFLRVFLNSNKFKKQIERLITGSAQPNFGPSHLSQVKMPLPQLPEQKRIAAILDKADLIRKKRQEAIRFLDEILQSVFLEMFGDPVRNEKGWEIKSFKELAIIDTKMITNFENFLDMPHIGIENIEKETGKLIDFITVKEASLVSGKYYFTSEHIIYSKIRPNLNKVALPYFCGLCSADSYPILVNKKICNKYFLAHIMRLKFFVDFMISLSSRTNIPKVNKEQLNNFTCICPPIDLQNKFAQVVEKTEQQKQLLEQSLVEMDDCFNSLMQKAFQGEL
jgi:type I restriction enzyme S subunit